MVAALASADAVSASLAAVVDNMALVIELAEIVAAALNVADSTASVTASPEMAVAALAASDHHKALAVEMLDHIHSDNQALMD
jgi:hypothetical protein